MPLYEIDSIPLFYFGVVVGMVIGGLLVSKFIMTPFPRNGGLVLMFIGFTILFVIYLNGVN